MQSNNPSFFEKANNWLKNSITIRLLIIGILILLLLIPVSMIKDLIREREYRQQDAIREVSSTWGEMQTVTGLVLTVPYYVHSKVYNAGKTEWTKTLNYAHFLPDDLNIAGNIAPELRYRGIFEVIVYKSQLQIDGFFSQPDFKQWKIDEKDVIWEDAFVSLELSDLRSLQSIPSVKWNESELAFRSGLATHDVISNGISAKVSLKENDTLLANYAFSVGLDFNGSTGLYFTPLGKTTTVNLESSWKDPKFDGAFLPDNREIDKNGFDAEWSVLHLNRSYPQSFRGAVTGINTSAFGVKLLMPVDEYQKSTRSVKYAVMFITLTFLIFFFVQILNQVRIHPVQYIIVGLALCVFYTLLIALSEHIKFNLSYLVSSVAIVVLITVYVKNIFKSKTLTALMFSILSLIYGFIYIIIQLQDYALLFGSLGLFVVMVVIMYLSRKIDWYSLKTRDNSASQ